MSKALNLRRARRARPGPPPPARIDGLIRVARANWFALLSYLAFVGVTLIGVVDLDFFIPERRTQLPLIGVSVPTTLFFAIAPMLGAMLYAHLHFYLIRLWSALAAPDAPPRGQIAPWLVTDAALSQRGDSGAYPLRWLTNAVVWLLIFWAAPVVLAGFWWRSAVKHDPWMTLVFCGLSLSLTLMIGAKSWVHLRRVMTGRAPRRAAGLSAVWWAVVFAAVVATGWLRAVNTLAYYAEFSVEWRGKTVLRSYWDRQKATLLAEAEQMQDDALKARFGPYAQPDDVKYLVKRDLNRRWWMHTIWPEALAKAQLEGAVFVETPPGWLPRDEAQIVYRRQWCKERGLPGLVCGPGPFVDAELTEPVPYQRQEWCRKTFPPPDQPSACAPYFQKLASTYRADWTKYRQKAVAALPAFNLTRGDWRYANLLSARLEGADLAQARMEGAKLWQVRMEGADLWHARMEGANLWKARMEGADLGQARMEGANLTLARMEGTDLRHARMEGADLTQVRMEGANLRHARMDKATSLYAADFSGAALRDVDYSDVPISQEQVNASFGDASVILPPGLTRPDHWPKWELGSDFYAEWQKWQADPAAYRPPPPPAD